VQCSPKHAPCSASTRPRESLDADNDAACSSLPPTRRKSKGKTVAFGLPPSPASGGRPALEVGPFARDAATTHGGQQDRMIAGDPCVLPCQSEPDSRLGWPVPRSPRAALASGCFAGLRLRPIMMWGVAVSSCLRVQESIQPSRQ
jgi:hypothetical protein